jgi:2-C-methyl-D-erythritol 4-phosphate cytidylyltransferase
MKVSVVIPVAGRGRRFGGDTLKQYLEIGNVPTIVLTLQKFVSLKEVSCGVVVAAENEVDRTYQLLSTLKGFENRFDVISGGDNRQDSVYRGIKHIPPDTDIIVVHDGVRPLVSTRIILNSIKTAAAEGACVTAVPAKETIKRVQKEQVIETLPRDQLWQVQTPQSFKYSILRDAHEKAYKNNFYSTDESALVEWFGFPVKVILGAYTNIKITTEEDIKLARLFYQESLSS